MPVNKTIAAQLTGSLIADLEKQKNFQPVHTVLLDLEKESAVYKKPTNAEKKKVETLDEKARKAIMDESLESKKFLTVIPIWGDKYAKTPYFDEIKLGAQPKYSVSKPIAVFEKDDEKKTGTLTWIFGPEGGAKGLYPTGNLKDVSVEFARSVVALFVMKYRELDVEYEYVAAGKKLTDPKFTMFLDNEETFNLFTFESW
jgi:hypothetical protein